MQARVQDSTSYYRLLLSFFYWGAGFVEGQTVPLGGADPDTGRQNLVFLHEGDGDAVIQMFAPVEGAPGTLRVFEADPSTNRLRATFEGTFARVGGRNDPYTRLPDTLRFTDGEFELEAAP